MRIDSLSSGRLMSVYRLQTAVEKPARYGRTQPGAGTPGVWQSEIPEEVYNRAVSMETVKSGLARGTESLIGAKLRIQEYERELEDARVNDPEKYQQMLTQRKQDFAKSFRQVEEMAMENGGTAIYNGVPISFDFDNKAMSIGDVSSGNVVHVGQLSNGYSFSFNMDNIDGVIAVMDLFSPSDINKIMEAITKFNMAKKAEAEIEEDKSKTPESAQEAEENAQEAEETREETFSQAAAGAGEITEKAEGLEALGAAGSGEAEEEEKKVTSEIVTNADGSRQLVITTRIGDSEVITKVELSPKKGSTKYDKGIAQAAYEQQFRYDYTDEYEEQFQKDLEGAVS